MVNYKECGISANEFRVNDSIRVAEVRLIGATGENVGVINIREALRMAREAELDLVEIAPNSAPPVCRIMDFGKFLFEKEKKDREARKAQTRVEIKEIRLRPKTTEHHRDFKVDDARRWLEKGLKVRATIRFRGREMEHVIMCQRSINVLKSLLLLGCRSFCRAFPSICLMRSRVTSKSCPTSSRV